MTGISGLMKQVTAGGLGDAARGAMGALGGGTDADDTGSEEFTPPN